MELFTKDYINIVFQKDKITEQDRQFLKDKILEKSEYADYLDFESLKERLRFYQLNDVYIDYFIEICKMNMSHVDYEIYDFIDRLDNKPTKYNREEFLSKNIDQTTFLKRVLKDEYSPYKKYCFKGECSNTCIRNTLDKVLRKEVNYYLEEPTVSVYEFKDDYKEFIKKVRLSEL